MIKVFVSSFYNTLINEEDAIPTSTMFELDRIRNQEVKFVIITNRLEEDVLFYNQSYPFIDYIISLNGSFLYDIGHDKRVHFSSFNKKELKEIQTKYSNHKIFYYTENACSNEIPEDKVYKVEVKVSKKEIDTIPKIDIYENTILKDNTEYYLEITKNTSYAALIKLMQTIKVKEAEMIGIVCNDSERMILEKIKPIYLMRNASKDLKELTNHITKTNKSKGVEAVIRKEIK